MNNASYGHTRTARERLRAELNSLMEGGSKRFCDVGGGANPLVPLADIEKFSLDYVVVDESQDELDKAPTGYQLFRLDMSDSAAVSEFVEQRGAFDVVVSKWTAEHVPDGRVFHEQIFDMLRPNGTAVHLFPTLYSPVFLLNRLLPPGLSNLILPKVTSGREMEGTHAKFRSYYSWCRGPSRRQLRRFQSVGFFVERYVGFFGHWYYSRIRPLQRAHEAITDQLVRHPLSSMTSYALVVLRRTAH
jgi:SAM-dependent methyltransferase